MKTLKNTLFTNLKGDIAGGLSSAVVALPGNIVYGSIAFAPLGADYAGMGIIAGMFSTVFAGFFAAMFGGTKAMVTGPQVPTALVFGSTIGQLLASKAIVGSFPPIDVILTLLFASAMIAGIVQFLFGIFKIGSLVKFIPYPVIAGILTGTGLLILKSQVLPVLGLNELNINDLNNLFAEIKYASFAVIFITGLFMWKGDLILKKFANTRLKFLTILPSSLLALLLGTLVHYIIFFSSLKIYLGNTIGSVPMAIPIPRYFFSFFSTFSDTNYWQFIPSLIVAGTTIAVLSSIDSLLSSLSMQNLTGARSDANKELKAQGIGTMIASIFGGLPGTGYTNRSMVNYESGGRTKLSGMLHATFILIIILFLAPVVQFIPMAVMTGITIIIGLKMIDTYSLAPFKEVLGMKLGITNDIVINAVVVLVVAIITLFSDLITAVGIGVLFSIIILIIQMSKSVIRRILSGTKIRSHKQRNEVANAVLEKYGNKIAIVELEGSLFFGSADSLAIEIDLMAEKGIKYIILDIKRIAHIDSTGAKILEQILKKDNIELIISYIKRGTELWKSLINFKVIHFEEAKFIAEDTEQALEYFEEKLLEEHKDEIKEEGKIDLDELLGVKDRPVEEKMMLTDYMEWEEHSAGTMIFKQGDFADSIYFIVRGAVNLSINLTNENDTKRLHTVSHGTFFGESSLLNSNKRSENAVVIKDLTCFKMSMENFRQLKNDYPDLAFDIMITINRTIVNRLEDTHRMISELEA